MSKLPIDILLDQVEWKPITVRQDLSDEMPYATHQGILKVGDIEMEVVQLSNGMRVIPEQSLIKFFTELAL